jgi:hypothetical protein
VIWNFFKICRDIRQSRCTTGINDTSSKFATDTASALDTSGKFAAGVNDISGNLPSVSTTPVANNENNIRLLAAESEVGEKNVSIC